MKKIFIAIAVLLLLGGCKNNESIPSEISESSRTEATSVTAVSEREEVTDASVTTAEASEITTAPTETSAAEREYIEGEEYLIGFLSYLQHKGFVDGESNYFSFDQGEDFSGYDFMDDFKIDGYSYQHRGDGIYDVTLTCSESSCDMFPNGDSYWVYGPGFFPAERENKILFPSDMYDVDEPLKTAFFAAVGFSLATWEFEADDEWLANYTDADVHSFYHAYNPYMEKDEAGGVYPEEYIRAVKRLYNIDIPTESFDYLYDRGLVEDGKVFSYCAHGASWLYDTFAGYEETDGEIKVRVDYYGDSMYFYPVIESEYIFSKNEDGTVTLQMVEKIFDTGYDYASGTV